MKNGSHKFSLIIFFLFLSFNTLGETIEGYAANLKILNKITSQIKSIEIHVNDTYNFETLKIELYACYKRPPEEIPEDFILLKIFDTLQDSKIDKIYQGWMISSSPATTPFEHPIYDIWVKECKIN